MPYFQDPNLEKEDEQSQGEVQLSGASPTTESSGVSDAGGSSNKELNTGSGYQNLDKYLSTNQGQQFGQQVLGKVSGEVEGAKTKQNEAANQFGQTVQSQNYIPTSEQVNSAIANPGEADAKEFQKWQSQNYSGPKSLAESPNLYNQFWSGTEKANTSAKLMGSEPGRFTLLDSYFGRPQYSFGEKSLDNLLVQQAGLGRQTRDLQNQATQLKSQGNVQANNLQNLASERAGQVDQSRQGVRQAIGIDDRGQIITGDGAGAIGKAQAEVEAQLAAKNKERQDIRALTEAGLNTNTRDGIWQKDQLTPEQLAELGLTAGENLYNVDFGNYYKAGGDLNKFQTMTPEQQSRIKALSQLAGVTDTFADGEITSADDAYGIDKDRLRNDINAAKAGWEREFAEYQSRVPQYAQQGEAGWRELEKLLNGLRDKYQPYRTAAELPSVSRVTPERTY